MKLNHSRSQSNENESLDENDVENYKINEVYPHLSPSVQQGLINFLKNKKPNKYKYILNDEAASNTFQTNPS